MSSEETKTEGKPRFIALRILAGLFLFGAIKNGVDLVLDEYVQESLLWIRYALLAVSMVGIILLYRWAYYLFLAVVLFSIVAFQILPPNTANAGRILIGLIGPAIISALMLPRWKLLK